MKCCGSVCLLLIIVNYVSSARILCLPVWPSYSHQIFYWPIWKELAKNGHELVVLTTDVIDDAPPNIKQIDLHFAYDIRHKTHNINKKLHKMQFNPLKLYQAYEDVLIDVLDQELSHPEVQKILNNETEHFDLVMVEMGLRPMYYFSVKFKCPYIVVTSTDLLTSIHTFYGNPTHPVIYPNIMSAIGDRKRFTDRLKIFGVALLDYIISVISPFGLKLQKVTEKHFGKDIPSWADMQNNVSMIFLNRHPVLSSQRPLGPGFVEIGGGLHLRDPKPLPNEIKDFLDNAPEGVIYFSLGTNVLNDHVSSELIDVFVDVFKEIPYKVLWKFENQSRNISENVKIIKWAPQQDVLRHENVKLMVFQCGLQSTEEALLNKIPVIAIPFISDQKKVCAEISPLEVGKVFEWKTITKELFKEAIIEIITNPKYKTNAERVSALLQDNPMTVLEKAVWWTEYVIRHKGTPHFWNKRTQMPFYQYYFLDTLAFTAIVFSILIYVVYKTITIVIFYSTRVYKSVILKKQKQH